MARLSLFVLISLLSVLLQAAVTPLHGLSAKYGLNAQATTALSAALSGATPSEVSDDDKDALEQWIISVGESLIEPVADDLLNWVIGKITTAITDDVVDYIWSCLDGDCGYNDGAVATISATVNAVPTATPVVVTSFSTNLVTAPPAVATATPAIIASVGLRRFAA